MDFIKDRLKQIAQDKGMSMRSFEENCGLGRGNISNMSPDASIGSDKLAKIIDRFPDVDIYWLITGKKGSSLKDKEEPVNTNFACDPHIQMYLDRIQAQAEEIGALKERLRAYELPKNATHLLEREKAPRSST